MPAHDPRLAATLTVGRLWYENECQLWDRQRKGLINQDQGHLTFARWPNACSS